MVDPFGYEHTLVSDEEMEHFCSLFEDPPCTLHIHDGIYYLVHTTGEA